MTVFLVSATAILVFIMYCWLKDSYGGSTNSFVAVMCHVVAKHVKLALKLGFGFILALFAIMSILGEAGAYSQSMTVYGKGPELEKHRSFSGKVWHEAASFLAPFALLICILSSWVQDFYGAHMTACNLALFGLYLVWLWFTVRAIVRHEYSGDDKAKWAFLSVAAMGTWAVVVVASGWGIRWVLAGVSL